MIIFNYNLIEKHSYLTFFVYFFPTVGIPISDPPYICFLLDEN